LRSKPEVPHFGANEPAWDSFVVQNGVPNCFAQTGRETLKGITKPVHWGCKGVKVLIVLFKVTKAMVFVMAISQKGYDSSHFNMNGRKATVHSILYFDKK
jgi:hypothetical protein